MVMLFNGFVERRWKVEALVPVIFLALPGAFSAFGCFAHFKDGASLIHCGQFVLPPPSTSFIQSLNCFSSGGMSLPSDYISYTVVTSTPPLPWTSVACPTKI